ncbi:MAG: class I SAM-dependent methyltransferase [Bacteroidota bacterium]
MSSTQADYRVGSLVHTGEVYDFVHNFDYDLEFYRARCREAGGPVLELCCGTGRLTVPLAQAGIPITGVDVSAEMLACARAKGERAGVQLPLVQGDVRALDLNQRFSLVILPFNSLQHFFALEDVEGIFGSVRQHLSPGGTFVLDLLHPNPAYLTHHSEQSVLLREGHLPDGRPIRVHQSFTYHPHTQVNRVKWRIELAGEVREEPVDMRCYFPVEMDALLRYNGFTVRHKYGDFLQTPFLPWSMKQVYVLGVG